MIDPDVLASRLDRAEKDIDDARKRTHGIDGTVQTLAGDVREMKTQLTELAKDFEAARKEDKEWREKLGDRLRYAGTTFLALAAIGIGLLAKGGL